MKVGTEPGNLLTLAAQLNDSDQQCDVLSLSMSVCVDTICDGGSPLGFLFVLGLVSKAVEPGVLFTLVAMIGAIARLCHSVGVTCSAFKMGDAGMGVVTKFGHHTELCTFTTVLQVPTGILTYSFHPVESN